MSGKKPVFLAVNGGNGVIGGNVVNSILFENQSPLMGNIRGRERFKIAAMNDLAYANGQGPDLLLDKLEKLGFKGSLQKLSDNEAQVDANRIRFFAERDPRDIEYGPLVSDMATGQLTVLECTGHWNKLEDSPKGERPAAAAHLDAGATSVIVSCPAKGMRTYVMGVNDHLLKPDDRIISNASCTTNAAAPILSGLIRELGMDIKAVHVHTTHAYTPDYPTEITDNNIIPANTSAIPAIPLVIPELEGKVVGHATRVPVSDGSYLIMNIVANPDQATLSEDQINSLFEELSLKENNVLAYSSETLDARQTAGSLHSAIFIGNKTQCLSNFYNVYANYDNNTAYACRMAEIAARLQDKQAEANIAVPIAGRQ